MRGPWPPLPDLTRRLAGSPPRWADAADPGLFGPGSVTWRIYREPALLLGAGRALLMQVAHPSVAAGVAQHSGFPAGAWRRLLRTLDVVSRITFGDTATAQETARALRVVHGSVRGIRSDGTPYRAGNPELLLWVWATLVDSTLAAYRTFVEDIPDGDLDRFVVEQHRFALACGVPASRLPAGYSDFAAYVADHVEHRLRVTREARRIAESVLIPPLPGAVAVAARPSLELLRQTTIALLPALLRRQYGLGWGPVREALFQVGADGIRRSTAVLGDVPLPRRISGAR